MYRELQFIGHKWTMVHEDCDMKCPLRKYLESVGAIGKRNKRKLKQIGKTIDIVEARRSSRIKA
jgi:hypothetical protein